jgi:hypothetical protein
MIKDNKQLNPLLGHMKFSHPAAITCRKRESVAAPVCYPPRNLKKKHIPPFSHTPPGPYKRPHPCHVALSQPPIYIPGMRIPQMALIGALIPGIQPNISILMTSSCKFSGRIAEIHHFLRNPTKYFDFDDVIV